MEDIKYGPVWILGMPFLRAFSAKFSRADDAQDTPAAAQPADGLNIGFAAIPDGQNPCAACPRAATGQAGRPVPHSPAAAHVHAPHEEGPLSVDLRHARLPSWAAGAAASPAQAHGRARYSL